MIHIGQKWTLDTPRRTAPTLPTDQLSPVDVLVLSLAVICLLSLVVMAALVLAPEQVRWLIRVLG